jgi:predicted nucleic acid-binding Zn ribbon protein
MVGEIGPGNYHRQDDPRALSDRGRRVSPFEARPDQRRRRRNARIGMVIAFAILVAGIVYAVAVYRGAMGS